MASKLDIAGDFISKNLWQVCAKFLGHLIGQYTVNTHFRLTGALVQIIYIHSVSNSVHTFTSIYRPRTTVARFSALKYTYGLISTVAAVKPRPHYQRCRSINGNNVEWVYRIISSFRQSRNKLNMFNFF